jgi:signal transduction histidine kinase/ActR/RegA family two-component response regulator
MPEVSDLDRVEDCSRPRQSWLAGQREALEAALNGAPLQHSLGALVRTATDWFGDGVRAAFYLADAEGATLHHIVGMPDEYAKAVEGFKIGPESLACGLATHTGLPVFTNDVTKEPLWAPWRWLAEKFGYRGCWSFPVHTTTGTFVGTFAVYWPEPREAAPSDLELAALMTQSAAIITARHMDAEVRRHAEEALRESRAALESELADSKLLQSVSAEMVQQGDLEALFEKIMDAAVAIMRSDFASLQMLYPERGVGGELRLLAFRGFNADAARFWTWVRADSETTCGMALRTRKRILAPDVEKCDYSESAKDLAMFLHTGIRACQTTPLLSRSGTLVGMISTHWAQPHEPTERDLRLLDILARQAADLIERRKADDALRDSEERYRLLYHDVEHANRAKDEFLATLSHELRTPLNAILGWSQVLRMGTVQPDVQKRALESVERNARAQAQLVDDLLDVSRIITGKLSIKSVPVDLASVVSDAVDAVKPAATAKRIRLHVEVEHGTHVVTGDADRLRQVVWNLLSNAVKFTPAEGRIDVHLRRRESSTEIVVRDTGQGIDPAFLPHVFERFRQADSSIARAHGGLGLGLALVRHLMEAHGGLVRAESGGVGQGATFMLSLPVRAVAEHSLSESGLAGMNDEMISGTRALVVDDESDARTLIQYVLETRGVDVTTAASAGEALHMLARHTFDVLISDIGMPEQDGLSLIRAIRGVLPTPANQIPAIAVTAYAALRERDEALYAGYDSHLAKPVEADRLIAAVAVARTTARAQRYEST